ncbi:unnamed protein product (macronuclear) [Paramecium tetraurelia]|uniref:Uncharacterized protein n=1 Tax=Paramecium tetraurelia TaxID=5888 RepID=A0EDT5_PARTE|nr:uncharacterized protein GSPATT00025796001 [Paramecium tetraurelia]CAK93452.1 unnamed protein product [Paramecium tetraurelia]|eukprot:XP_001460849.1 hypothetical protein (macronuclear) [Paramecium tetraurelia strain d4-2]
MKLIFIAILLVTSLASASKLSQEQPFNQQEYCREQEIAINLKLSNYIILNTGGESALYQKPYSTQPRNQDLKTLFYKLLTIQV